MSDRPAETFALGVVRPALTAPFATSVALDAFFATLPPRGRWSTAQARARHALAAWLEDSATRRCMLFGPAGAGKTLLCAAMADDAQRASFVAAFIPIGRATGLALPAQVLGLLAAMLKENEEPPAPADPKRLRWAIRLAILNGRDEDEAPWLIVLDGVDELVCTPVEPNFDAVKDVGSRTHVLASVTGGIDEAHAWCKRLGWKVEETTFVALEALTPEEAEAIGVFPLARFTSNAAGAEALVVDLREALRELPRGAEVERALTTLARLLGPVSSLSLDVLAGSGSAAAVKTEQDRLTPLLRWLPGPEERVTFAHEPLRAAWEHQTASEDERVEVHILEVLETVLTDSRFFGLYDYAFSYGSVHMALAGAGADALARFVEPRWAHATSPTRASQIFADLRLARRALNKAFLDAIAEDTWGPDAPWALGKMARCTLARASNEERAAEERWAELPLLADDKARAELEAAQAEALYGLAESASADLQKTLLVEAIERASGIGPRGPVTPRLVGIAQDAARKGKLDLAHAALERLARLDDELDDEGEAVLHFVVPLVALLPGEDAERWIRDAFTRARRKRRPREACARLVPSGGLTEEIARALRHAAAAEAPENSVDLLGRLIPWLPAEEQRAALTEVLAAYERSMADPEAPIGLDESTRTMLTPYLSEEQARVRLADVPIWSVSALAERFASLGHIGEAKALIDRWLEAPMYREPAILRVAAVVPPEARPALAAELEERMAALDEAQRARLVREAPGAAVLVLGPDVTLAAASGCASFAYGAVIALAAVTPHLPEARRPEATRLLMERYRQEPDSDALAEVVSLAPWITRADAAFLVTESLGEVVARQTMVEVLSSWGSLAQLAPLIARAGGDAALEAAAAQVREAGQWV
jgi:hypothetical protein